MSESETVIVGLDADSAPLDEDEANAMAGAASSSVIVRVYVSIAPTVAFDGLD